MPGTGPGHDASAFMSARAHRASPDQKDEKSPDPCLSAFVLSLQLGMGKHEPDAFVFCNHDGKPISPYYYWQK
jgi:hypothetical protein